VAAETNEEEIVNCLRAVFRCSAVQFWLCGQAASVHIHLDKILRINLLGNANWIWGLSLNALTIAFHAMAIVMMAPW
jgi:hypothetical protein